MLPKVELLWHYLLLLMMDCNAEVDLMEKLITICVLLLLIMNFDFGE